MTTHQHHLSDGQRRTLKRLEQKEGSISAYEEGQLVAFRMFGTVDEKKRADAVLRRAQEAKK
jgi:hypothetical protein